MTQFLLAAMDPSHRTDDGTYWCWHHPDLDETELNKLYQDRIARILPSIPDLLATSNFIGGVCSVPHGRWCWFRVLPGGRDKQGRNGRHIIVCAITVRSIGTTYDCSGILRSSTFESLAQSAPRQFPLETPDSLSLEMSFPSLIGSELPRSLLESHEINYSGDNGLAWLASVVAKIPADEQFAGRVVTTGELSEAFIEILTAPNPPLTPVSFAPIPKPAFTIKVPYVKLVAIPLLAVLLLFSGIHAWRFLQRLESGSSNTSPQPVTSVKRQADSRVPSTSASNKPETW